MTIQGNAASLRLAANRVDPNKLPDILRSVNFGDMLRALPVALRGITLDGSVGVAGAPVAATNKYVLAAAHSETLPDDAKAARIVRVYARSGSGTLGPLVIDGPLGYDSFTGSEPAAGHCTISPTGDLLFQHADAWTSVDVVYEPEKFVMYEQTLAAASNQITMPTAPGLILFVSEVEALIGTSVGKKIVDVVGTAPAAGHAALDLAKLVLKFQATDAVTQARVKWGVIPAVDLNALLEAASNF